MSSITTIQSTDLITDSRTDINTNFSNLNTDKIETSYLDTDTALTANSDAKIATQKAVKAYVDTYANPLASTTAKGVVEEATDAQVVAGTDTGETGAKLFVPPSKLNTQIALLEKSKKIEVDATEVTVGNTDVEATLFDVSIPANTLGTSNAIKLETYLSFKIKGGGGATAIFRLKYGATTITTLTLTADGATSGDPLFNALLTGFIIADGATNAQKGALIFSGGDGQIEEDAQTQVGGSKGLGGAKGTATEDSTAVKTLTLTADFGTANPASTVTAEFWVVQVIK